MIWLQLLKRLCCALGFCGGACKLQPAVTLRDFLLSGEALDVDTDSDLIGRLGKEDQYPPSQMHRPHPRSALAVEFRGSKEQQRTGNFGSSCSLRSHTITNWDFRSCPAEITHVEKSGAKLKICPPPTWFCGKPGTEESREFLTVSSGEASVWKPDG